MRSKFLTCLPSIVLLTICHSTMAQSRKDNIGMDYLNSEFATYDSIQKKIHSLAEPGYQEYESSELLIRHLEEHGFDIERGVAGIPTAFIATFGSGSPVIGLLGEYDALPGMSQDTTTFLHPRKVGGAGHACGHNLIGTATAAAAVAISKYLAQGHDGTVRYFGCPAEEGGGGKYYMTEAGCFDGCDAVFDWHTGSANLISLSPWQANMMVKFTFKGVASHAGGAPWKGRSALDAVEAFDYMMNLMREHVPLGTRIHYTISNGGQAPNIVPAMAEVKYYFRHRDSRIVRDVFERAIKAAEGAAMGTGTQMEYEIINACYEKLINRTLAEIMLKNMQKVGGVMLDAREMAFAENLARTNDGDRHNCDNFAAVPKSLQEAVDFGASTDVGNVSQVVPVASIEVATYPDCHSLHTWQAASCAGTTIGTKVLLNTAGIFYWTALDLYRDPKSVRAIREEYESAQGKDYKFRPLMDRKPPLDYCR